jgi:hypothetical protein
MCVFIVLSDLYRIRISVRAEAGTAQVQLQCGENPTKWLDVSTQIQLEKTVDGFGKEIMGGVGEALALADDLPRTHLRRIMPPISSLIGGAEIEAIFDPYLDNSSLTNNSRHSLIWRWQRGERNSITWIGEEVNRCDSQNLRKQELTLGSLKLEYKGEARVMAGNDETSTIPYYMSGSKSLIIGSSFNAIHKNEATHVEPDAEDRKFFEDVWRAASLLV